jgi:hypothetical protein
MRSVVAALVVLALLAVWLTTQYPDDTGQTPAQTGRDVTPVTMPQQTDLLIEDQEAFQVTISGEASADTIETNDFRDSTMQTAVIEFSPQMRAGIVDYFSGSGLAVVDSERIADAVLDGLGECIELALGNGDAEFTSRLGETCIFNVFADYGLGEIPVTEIDLAISLP